MISLFRYIQVAQREGMARSTAYGAYRKAGGTISPTIFRRMWKIAERNPFHWNHAKT